ncbi:MAG TPA: M48 family metallopeptidase [Gammaproteobacteria bacterium]|jgi:predicted Zn-dependent protease
MRLDSTRLAAAILGGFVASLALGVAQGALWVSEKEIERRYRVEWLSMKKHMPIVQDERVNRYVRCVANDIVKTLDEQYQALNWEVIVFDDAAQNAQVMPGGKVAIYSGILDVADTPDALAAVIGHEAAHLTQGHVIERERRAAQSEALTMIGNAATGLGGMVSDATMLAFMLPFTREQETEADAVGMHYMSVAGYDPRSVFYLWKGMAADDDSRPAEFASTHPAPDTRMADLVPHLTQALTEYNHARESGVRPHCGN